MCIPDFSIPLNREDLLNPSNPGQFYVVKKYSLAEISEGLEAARTATVEEGTDFIIDHFPVFYSLLQTFKQCPQLVREKGWKTIRKGFSLLSKNLQVLLEDNLDSELQFKMCNITKMIVYILIEMMKLYQDLYVQLNSNSLDGKPKKKPNKVMNADWDWNEEKHSVLIELHSFLQCPLKLLWEPPVVDEDFINLIANFCYSCLEDPLIGISSIKYLRETVFQILGILIKNYLHGLSFCVKVVQLLKMNDHLVNPLAQGVIHLVQECKCSNIVKEIVREVSETDGDQLAADTAGTRSLNLFLVQIAESVPEAIIPAIDLLISHLSGDSYSMRICVVGVLSEILLNVLTKENLEDNMKIMRDEYLDCLEEHIHDINAFVRTKVLSVWQKLCTGKAIPISRINRLLESVVGRLNDKSTNVKKQAVHLIKDLLEGNPFCGQLNISEIQNQLQQEKKKLELIEKEYNLDNTESEWKKIESQLQLILEDLDTNNIDSKGIEYESIEEMINTVGNYLCNRNYEEAITTMMNLQKDFYKFFNIEDNCNSSETLIEILQKIFGQKKKSLLLNVPPEVQEKIQKHITTIEYLENALEFSKLIDRALPIILTFLDSSVVTDVLEAIHFFSAAYLFGFTQALEGVRKMLYLVFSKEANIKAAVSEAYKNIYFQQNGGGRQQTVATVQNLSELVLKLNYSQLEALEEVVKEWVKTEILGKSHVQIMFERFSMKIPGTKINQCWAAAVLIRMFAAEEPKVIKSNMSVLLNEGLKNMGAKNFLLAKEVCKALQHLLPLKEQGKAFDQTLRYKKDHEVFRVIFRLLKVGIWKTDDPYYIPLADEAINLVFAICEEPDDFCKNLIVDLFESIQSGKRPVDQKSTPNGNMLNKKNIDDSLMVDFENNDPNEQKHESEVIENESETSENINELYIQLLTRFISILGQVASNYVLFLEGPVLDELKLRNQFEYERKMKKFEENKKFNVSLKKSRKGGNESRNGNLNETGAEDLEFNRVAADDMDAEEMKKETETKIVLNSGFFAKFVPLILTICKNPGKFNNKPLQNAALLTLAKFMHVSSVFCEENLQLLVTICEKSQIPERQENAIIALGCLQYKFPNCLEPWTPHMYAMLQNPNPSVRYNSLLVLTDLIVNEMIKVRTYISNLAICIVDKEINIARVARHFFREYSRKGNSLYNVLPSLMSSLTQSNSVLCQEDFRIVMKYILGLVTKDKQSEYLVEKICQYFDSASTERQWCDLAYCLSLLNYNDKGLKKIIDNMKCFANKIYLADVYEAFCTIVSEAGKNSQKDKSLINELNDIIKEYRDKSCEDKSICPVVKKQCMTSTRKNNMRKKYIPSDSDEEESEKIVRTSQRKRKILLKKEYSDSEDEHLLSDESTNKEVHTKNTERQKENTFSDSDSEEFVKRNIKTKTKSSAVKKIRRDFKPIQDSSDEEIPENKTKRTLRNRNRR